MLNTITNVLTATSSELSSLLSNVTATTSTASVGDMLFALILGVVMGFLISLVYIFTHKKSGYTQSYVMTLLMLPPIVAIVLVMINSMASALSLAGVFTLCRYRTVPGDPKDITYVFFAMAIGSLFELIYSIQLKNDVDQKKFMDEIRKRNGNLTVILSLYCYEDQVYDK